MNENSQSSAIRVFKLVAYPTVLLALFAGPAAGWAQQSRESMANDATATAANAQTGGQCSFRDVPGAVWWGTSSQMTLGRLAAYLAPVYWFSPDEPLLRDAEGEAISIPQALPFERAADGPVVYYQFEELVSIPDDDVTPFTRARSPSYWRCQKT